MSLARIATSLLALAYPALVYFGLTAFEPRILGLLLLAIVLLRHGRSAAGFLKTTDTAERLFALAMIALSTGIVAVNSELLLRLYPAILSLGMFLMFARTLSRPPSMIERFARLQDPGLTATGVRYTYRVTQVWCVFLASNATIALCTVFASREIWALWNGLLSYIAMGSLFAGEWLLRRRVMDKMDRMEHART